MTTVAICGNVKNKIYDDFVQAARHIYNVHDFADGVNIQTQEDLRWCKSLYVIGKQSEISDETWDIISYAYIMGVEIIPVSGIRLHIIRFKAVEFLRNLADGIEQLT